MVNSCKFKVGDKVVCTFKFLNELLEIEVGASPYTISEIGRELSVTGEYYTYFKLMGNDSGKYNEISFEFYRNPFSEEEKEENVGLWDKVAE